MATEAPPSIYVQNPRYGKAKAIEPDDLQEHLDLGFEVLVNPIWLYHRSCPDGRIVCSSKLKELKARGWVHSLVDIETAKEHAPALEIQNAAGKLLSGSGLSQSALMREIGLNPQNVKKRSEFKPVYTEFIKTAGKLIRKSGMLWFWADDERK